MYFQKPQLMLLVCLVICMGVKAQDSSRLDKALSFPDKLFFALDKKTCSIEQKLNRQTDKYLNKLQRRENKLRKKIYKKDSSTAKQLFEGANEKYDQLTILVGVTKKDGVLSFTPMRNGGSNGFVNVSKEKIETSKNASMEEISKALEEALSRCE